MKAHRFGRVGIAALLAVFALASTSSLSAHADEPGDAVAARAAEQSPDKVAHDFYAWYLGQLAQNRDPLTLKAPQLRDYVSPALLAEIDRRMHSADGMDADYFLKTQDYLDAWLTHVAVGSAKIAGQSATALVTLGAPASAKDDLWKLRVTLARDGKGWKIRSVAKG